MQAQRVMTAHTRTTLMLAALVVIFAGLHFAQAFFVPALLATILAALTAPIASFLTRRGAPPVVGAIVGLLVNVALVFLVGLLLAAAASELQEKVPSYLARLSSLLGAAASSLERRGIPATTEQMTHAFHTEDAAGVVRSAVGEVVDAASSAAVVLLLVFFALCETASLSTKLRDLLADPASGFLRMERIVRQLRQYLLVKTLTSLAVAVMAFTLLSVLHVDLALLLAVILFLLHFIPTVGAAIAAVPAVFIALVQHGPSVALAVAIGYLVAGTVVGNVIEPRVLGRTMGLSPLVVLLSMLFWGFVWGAAGAVLSVPLTMVAKIVLANDREWAWIARLLEPPEMTASKDREKPASSPGPTLRGRRT